MQIYIKIALLLKIDEKQNICTSENLMAMLYGTSVCGGTCVVLKNILERASYIFKKQKIECTIIQSLPDKNNTPHAYNQVKLNGEWYNCDLRWDSSSIEMGKIEDLLKNCLKSKKDFEISIYHKKEHALGPEHTSTKSYENIENLFIKNMIALSEKENPQEQFILGYMYEKGIMLEKNYEKALKLYQKAANLGYPDAQNNIALMYGKGLGIEKNYEIARNYLEIAASNGSINALENLAEMYEIGMGVEPNVETALNLYEEAAAKGSKYALRQINRLTQKESKHTNK